MRALFVAAALVAVFALPGAARQAQAPAEAVRAIAPPTRPLPPEAGSAGVTDASPGGLAFFAFRFIAPLSERHTVLGSFDYAGAKHEVTFTRFEPAADMKSFL